MGLRAGPIVIISLSNYVDNVRPLCYSRGMKKKGIENKAYIQAMREIRRSNKAGTHDNRPNRQRTRATVIRSAIKEYA